MQSDGFNSALSPVVYGDIALSINNQYNTILKIGVMETHTKIFEPLSLRTLTQNKTLNDVYQ